MSKAHLAVPSELLDIEPQHANRSYVTQRNPAFPRFVRTYHALEAIVKLVILPGDYRERATPVPIPNTEVKPLNADGTALGWESRSSPGFFYFLGLSKYRFRI